MKKPDRKSLLAVLSAAGFTPPARTPLANLVACATAVQMKQSGESPYLQEPYVPGTLIWVIESDPAAPTAISPPKVSQAAPPPAATKGLLALLRKPGDQPAPKAPPTSGGLLALLRKS